MLNGRSHKFPSGPAGAPGFKGDSSRVFPVQHVPIPMKRKSTELVEECAGERWGRL